MTDFYGGSSNAGAGGFDAGGYDNGPSPNAGGTPGSDRKAGDRSEQTLVPVTIKAILESQKSGDRGFLIDGIVASQVKLVAAIREVEEHSLNMTFTVEDGTGSMQAKLWIDDAETDSSTLQRATWTKGAYIRIIGQIREPEKRRHVVAFNIQTIKNFDAVTYHLLSVIHTHALLTSSATPPATGAAGALVQKGTMVTAPRGDSLLAEQQSTVDGPVSGPQHAILQLFKDDHDIDEMGLDIKIITQKLVGKFSADQVKVAVAELAEEGHIYSTIDDDHYMVT